MAIKRMVIDGYGQLELNQVAFPRDGRIEAQCALYKEDFALDREVNTDKIYAECSPSTLHGSFCIFSSLFF